MLVSTIPILFFASLVTFLGTAQICRRWWRRRSFVKYMGYKPPLSLSQSDKLLGLDTLKTSWSHFQDCSYLNLSKVRFQEHGNTFQFNQLGRTIVNTIEPDNIQTMLSTRFEDFALGERRRTAFEMLIGRGIFTTDGESWKHSRKLIRPALTTNEQLRDLSGLEKNVQSLLLQITDQPLDLQRKFLMLTIDFATHVLFGPGPPDSLNSSEAATENKIFGAAFDRAQRAVAKFFVLGPLSLFALSTRFKRDQKIVSSFVDKYIEQALDKSDKDAEIVPRSFLSELSKHTQDRSLLRGGILNVLLAGRDTTASLLSNLWFTLARRSDVYQRLREEIDELDGRVPTWEDISSLRYLKCCLDESLRLYPPIPRNSRTAVRDTVLPTGGGENGKSPIFIPKGTQVGYQAFALHRRSDIWGKDAEDFTPERWMEMGHRRPCWEYIPFSKGPRICPGQQLALVEASYVTVRLVQAFKHIKNVEGPGDGGQNGLWRENLGLTCSSADGTWVQFTRN